MGTPKEKHASPRLRNQDRHPGKPKYVRGWPPAMNGFRNNHIQMQTSKEFCREWKKKELPLLMAPNMEIREAVMEGKTTERNLSYPGETFQRDTYWTGRNLSYPVETSQQGNLESLGSSCGQSSYLMLRLIKPLECSKIRLPTEIINHKVYEL